MNVEHQLSTHVMPLKFHPVVTVVVIVSAHHWCVCVIL
jgi:hypothetical protein